MALAGRRDAKGGRGAIYRDVARLARVCGGGENFHFMFFLLTNAISALPSWRLRQEINKGHTISRQTIKKKKKVTYNLTGPGVYFAAC